VLIETVAIRGGVAPLWEHHVARMRLAAAELGLPAPDIGAPKGGDDRVIRLLLDRRGISTKTRGLGSQGPVRLATVGVPHQPYPHKTVQRAVFDRALAEAQGAGADEPLLLAEGGLVAETARFAVIWETGDGTLAAPPLGLGILPSVGRVRLAEIACGIAEQALERAALDGRPMALVNAVRGVVPIGSLDGTEVPQSALLEWVAERFWP